MSTQATAPTVDRKAYRENLAQRVATAFAKLADHKSDIEELWDEFEALPDGDTIMGCSTKTEFCDKVLGRSIRAIQFLVYGRPPQKHEHSSRPDAATQTIQADKEYQVGVVTVSGEELQSLVERAAMEIAPKQNTKPQTTKGHMSAPTQRISNKVRTLAFDLIDTGYEELIATEGYSLKELTAAKTWLLSLIGEQG